MTRPPQTPLSPAAARLTALWALAEVGLGGALHALRLPVTGLLVGGSAVLLLALIAEAARRDGLPVARALLAATATVLALKAAASPHAPVGAFLAVAFQGALAAVVLPTLGPRAGPLVLGVVALAESAVQRVVVLTVLFGTTLWDALDALAALAAARLGPLVGLDLVPYSVSASVVLVGTYVGVHVAVGAVIGALAARLPARAFAAAAGAEAADLAHAVRTHPTLDPPSTPNVPRWWRRPSVRRGALAVGLLAAYAATSLASDDPAPLAAAALALVRAAVLVGAWATLAAPLARRLLLRATGRTRRAADLARVAAQFPRLRLLVRLAWVRSRGPGHALAFVRLLAAATLAAPPEAAP